MAGDRGAGEAQQRKRSREEGHGEEGMSALRLPVHNNRFCFLSSSSMGSAMLEGWVEGCFSQKSQQEQRPGGREACKYDPQLSGPVAARGAGEGAERWVGT